MFMPPYGGCGFPYKYNLNWLITTICQMDTKLDDHESRITAIETALKNLNMTIDEEIKNEVERLLAQWYEDGTLETLVNPAVNKALAEVNSKINANTADIQVNSSRIDALSVKAPQDLGTDATVDEYGFIYPTVFQRLNNNLHGLHWYEFTPADKGKFFPIPTTGFWIEGKGSEYAKVYVALSAEEAATGLSVANVGNGQFISEKDIGANKYIYITGLSEGQTFKIYWGELDSNEIYIGCPMSFLNSGVPTSTWVPSSAWLAYYQIPLGSADNIDYVVASLKHSIYILTSTGEAPVLDSSQTGTFTTLKTGAKIVDIKPFHGKGIYITLMVRNDDLITNNTPFPNGKTAVYTKFYTMAAKENLIKVKWIAEMKDGQLMLDDNMMRSFFAFDKILPDLEGYQGQKYGLGKYWTFFQKHNTIFYGGDFYYGQVGFNLDPVTMITAMLNPFSEAYHTQFDNPNKPNGQGFVCSTLTAYLHGEPCPRSVFGYLYGPLKKSQTKNFNINDMLLELKPGDILIQETKTSGHSITVERIRNINGEYIIDCLESTSQGMIESAYPVHIPARSNNSTWFQRAFDSISQQTANSIDRTTEGLWVMPYTTRQDVMCNKGYNGLYLKNNSNIYVACKNTVTQIEVYVNDALFATTTVSTLNPTTIGDYNIVNLKKLLASADDGKISLVTNTATEIFYLHTATKNFISGAVSGSNYNITVNDPSKIYYIDAEYTLDGGTENQVVGVTWNHDEYTINENVISIPSTFEGRLGNYTIARAFIVYRSPYNTLYTYFESPEFIDC